MLELFELLEDLELDRELLLDLLELRELLELLLLELLDRLELLELYIMMSLHPALMVSVSNLIVHAGYPVEAFVTRIRTKALFPADPIVMPLPISVQVVASPSL